MACAGKPVELDDFEDVLNGIRDYDVSAVSEKARKQLDSLGKLLKKYYKMQFQPFFLSLKEMMVA